MRKFLFIYLWIIAMLPLRAFSAEEVRFSILTCAPGTEIYALFGHSALRYENPSKGQDWVFNYGMFSFSEPNFVMRFLKGETDYHLGVIPYRYFEAEYAMRGSSVYQQVLNLTDQEKERLIRLLETNYLPANRVYRYNYFYDNCTTRARDKVEECLEGKVVYPKYEKAVTFRDIIHEYTAGSPWNELGIDLCLGSEADLPIDERKQMFAPFYFWEAAKGAMIHRTDTVVPFVREERKVVDVTRDDDSSFPLSPMACAFGLLVLTGGMVCWGIKRGKMCWVWDALLFGAQGLGGCVIAFLFFFSLHPTVGSNWMILLFNPIPLLYLPVMIAKARKGTKDLYHWMNVVYLTSFIILMPFIPQEFNATVLPLALNWLLASAGHVYIDYRKH